MSKPTNSAARNQMTEWERQCYDWGWEDAEERIIKLLKKEAKGFSFIGNFYAEAITSELISKLKGEQN